MFKSIVLFSLLALDTEAIKLRHKEVKAHHHVSPMLAQVLGPTADDIMAEFDADDDGEISK